MKRWKVPIRYPLVGLDGKPQGQQEVELVIESDKPPTRQQILAEARRYFLEESQNLRMALAEAMAQGVSQEHQQSLITQLVSNPLVRSRGGAGIQRTLQDVTALGQEWAEKTQMAALAGHGTSLRELLNTSMLSRAGQLMGVPAEEVGRTLYEFYRPRTKEEAGSLYEQLGRAGLRAEEWGTTPLNLAMTALGGSALGLLGRLSPTLAKAAGLGMGGYFLASGGYHSIREGMKRMPTEPAGGLADIAVGAIVPTAWTVVGALQGMKQARAGRTTARPSAETEPATPPPQPIEPEATAEPTPREQGILDLEQEALKTPPPPGPKQPVDLETGPTPTPETKKPKSKPAAKGIDPATERLAEMHGQRLVTLTEEDMHGGTGITRKIGDVEPTRNEPPGIPHRAFLSWYHSAEAEGHPLREKYVSVDAIRSYVHDTEVGLEAKKIPRDSPTWKLLDDLSDCANRIEKQGGTAIPRAQFVQFIQRRGGIFMEEVLRTTREAMRSTGGGPAEVAAEGAPTVRPGKKPETAGPKPVAIVPLELEPNAVPDYLRQPRAMQREPDTPARRVWQWVQRTKRSQQERQVVGAFHKPFIDLEDVKRLRDQLPSILNEQMETEAGQQFRQALDNLVTHVEQRAGEDPNVRIQIDQKEWTDWLLGQHQAIVERAIEAGTEGMKPRRPVVLETGTGETPAPQSPPPGKAAREKPQPPPVTPPMPEGAPVGEAAAPTRGRGRKPVQLETGEVITPPTKGRKPAQLETGEAVTPPPKGRKPVQLETGEAVAPPTKGRKPAQGETGEAVGPPPKGREPVRLETGEPVVAETEPTPAKPKRGARRGAKEEPAREAVTPEASYDRAASVLDKFAGDVEEAGGTEGGVVLGMFLFPVPLFAGAGKGKGKKAGAPKPPIREEAVPEIRFENVKEAPEVKAPETAETPRIEPEKPPGREVMPGVYDQAGVEIIPTERPNLRRSLFPRRRKELVRTGIYVQGKQYRRRVVQEELFEGDLVDVKREAMYEDVDYEALERSIRGRIYLEYSLGTKRIVRPEGMSEAQWTAYQKETLEKLTVQAVEQEYRRAGQSPEVYRPSRSQVSSAYADVADWFAKEPETQPVIREFGKLRHHQQHLVALLAFASKAAARQVERGRETLREQMREHYRRQIETGEWDIGQRPKGMKTAKWKAFQEEQIEQRVNERLDQALRIRQSNILTAFVQKLIERGVARKGEVERAWKWVTEHREFAQRVADAHSEQLLEAMEFISSGVDFAHHHADGELILYDNTGGRTHGLENIGVFVGEENVVFINTRRAIVKSLEGDESNMTLRPFVLVIPKTMVNGELAAILWRREGHPRPLQASPVGAFLERLPADYYTKEERIAYYHYTNEEARLLGFIAAAGAEAGYERTPQGFFHAVQEAVEMWRTLVAAISHVASQRGRPEAAEQMRAVLDELEGRQGERDAPLMEQAQVRAKPSRETRPAEKTPAPTTPEQRALQEELGVRSLAMVTDHTIIQHFDEWAQKYPEALLDELAFRPDVVVAKFEDVIRLAEKVERQRGTPGLVEQYQKLVSREGPVLSDTPTPEELAVRMDWIVQTVLQVRRMRENLKAYRAALESRAWRAQLQHRFSEELASPIRARYQMQWAQEAMRALREVERTVGYASAEERVKALWQEFKELRQQYQQITGERYVVKTRAEDLPPPVRESDLRGEYVAQLQLEQRIRESWVQVLKGRRSITERKEPAQPKERPVTPELLQQLFRLKMMKPLAEPTPAKPRATRKGKEPVRLEVGPTLEESGGQVLGMYLVPPLLVRAVEDVFRGTGYMANIARAVSTIGGSRVTRAALERAQAILEPLLTPERRAFFRAVSKWRVTTGDIDRLVRSIEADAQIDADPQVVRAVGYLQSNVEWLEQSKQSPFRGKETGTAMPEGLPQSLEEILAAIARPVLGEDVSGKGGRRYKRGEKLSDERVARLAEHIGLGNVLHQSHVLVGKLPVDAKTVRAALELMGGMLKELDRMLDLYQQKGAEMTDTQLAYLVGLIGSTRTLSQLLRGAASDAGRTLRMFRFTQSIIYSGVLRREGTHIMNSILNQVVEPIASEASMLRAMQNAHPTDLITPVMKRSNALVVYLLGNYMLTPNSFLVSQFISNTVNMARNQLARAVAGMALPVHRHIRRLATDIAESLAMASLMERLTAMVEHPDEPQLFQFTPEVIPHSLWSSPVEGAGPWLRAATLVQERVLRIASAMDLTTTTYEFFRTKAFDLMRSEQFQEFVRTRWSILGERRTAKNAAQWDKAYQDMASYLVEGLLTFDPKLDNNALMMSEMAAFHIPSVLKGFVVPDMMRFVQLFHKRFEPYSRLAIPVLTFAMSGMWINFLHTPLALLARLRPLMLGRAITEKNARLLVRPFMEGEKPYFWAQVLTGAVASVIGYYLRSQGMIMGELPADPDERRMYYRMGVRPYSVKIGDRWVDFRYFQPYYAALMLGINLHDMLHEVPVRTTRRVDTSALRRWGDMGIALMRQSSEQTVMFNIENFIRVQAGEENADSRFVGGILSGLVPYYALWRTMRLTTDPYVRRYETPLQYVMNNMPYLSTKLPPRYGLLGEKEKMHGTAFDRFFHNFILRGIKPEHNKYYETLALVNVSPADARRVLEDGLGAELLMDKDAYTEYLRRSGELFRMALTPIVQSDAIPRTLEQYQNNPKQLRLVIDVWRESLTNLLIEARNLARSEFLAHYYYEKSGAVAVPERYMRLYNAEKRYQQLSDTIRKQMRSEEWAKP